MKLTEAIKIAIDCGLTTYGEVISNIDWHAVNIFNYDDIYSELSELVEDFKATGKELDDKF